MKKTLLVLALIGIGCLMAACARNRQMSEAKEEMTTEHMTFMNIPIDGDVTDFAYELFGMGYIGCGNAIIGRYMNEEGCVIRMGTVQHTELEDTRLMYMVSVEMPKREGETETDVTKRMLRVEDVLTEEFGEPNRKAHYKGVKPLPCASSIEFESLEGYVVLGMTEKGSVMLFYIDKQNARKNQMLTQHYEKKEGGEEEVYERDNAS